MIAWYLSQIVWYLDGIVLNLWGAVELYPPSLPLLFSLLPHMFPPLHFGAGLKRISVSRKQRQRVLYQQSGQLLPGGKQTYTSPTDPARNTQTAPLSVLGCLGLSVCVCWRLLASHAPCRGLGGVWWMSGGCLEVSEWNSWTSEALRCVWGVSGFSVLALWSHNTIWHSPERHDLFSPYYTGT